MTDRDETPRREDLREAVEEWADGLEIDYDRRVGRITDEHLDRLVAIFDRYEETNR